MKYLFIAILLVLTESAIGANKWRIHPKNALNQEDYDRLAVHWPLLSKVSDVGELMQMINQAKPYSRVEAFLENDEVVFKLTPAHRIAGFRIETLTRRIARKAKDVLHIYRGQVDSKELRQKIIVDLKKLMQQEGYYDPTLSIAEQNHILSIRIDENYPCLIRKVQFEFSLPKDVSFDVSVGSVCLEDAINEAVRQFKKDLTEKGYNSFRILPVKIDYDRKSNSAIVNIPGSLGKIYRSEVNSTVQNSVFIDNLLGDKLHSIDPSISDPNAMKAEIESNFEREGFREAVVDDPVKLDQGKDVVNYSFYVNAGPKYYIEDVQLSGIRLESTQDALSSINLISSLSKKPVLNEENIRYGIEDLSSYYQNKGYWDAKVYYPLISKVSGNSGVKLNYRVEEGRRRVLERIIIRGNRAFSESYLLDLVDIQPSEALLWENVYELQRLIKNTYRQSGYLYTKVKIDLIQNRRFQNILTTISVVIEEGARVKFGEVSISGLTNTKELVVRRELAFRKGDWFSPAKVEQSRQALIDLGLFSLISITADNSSDFTAEKTFIPYKIVVREAKPGIVSFGPGWSLYRGGRFSLDSAYNNVDGYARQVFANASYSEELHQSTIGNRMLLGYNLSIGYVEPYVFNQPVKGVITLGQSASAKTEQWEVTKTVKASLQHKYLVGRKKLQSEVFTLFKATQEEASAETSQILNTDEIQIRELGFGTTWDGRDSVSWPTRGQIIKLRVSWADFVLGGDTKYFHWLFSTGHYFQLSDNFVFASRILFDSYSNVIRSEESLDILPSSERLESGGPETNRGFRQGDLGPVVQYTDDIRIGGTQAFNFTLEMRYRVTSSMGLTLFIDSSNSFLTQEEATNFQRALDDSNLGDVDGASDPILVDNFHYEFEDLISDPSFIWKKNYSSWGVSGSYFTPLGSVNVSYGFPFERCPIQGNCSVPRGNQQYKKIRGGQLQINVGTSF